MNKLLLVALGVIAVLSGGFIAQDVYAERNESAGGSQLTDIQGHWAEAAIRTAVSEGKVAGYPDGTFLPDREITRAEAAALISRVTKQKPQAESKAFPELERHWGREDILKLVAAGFISESDYPDGFGPDQKITRYEIVKWLASGLASSNESFRKALQDSEKTLLPTPETFKGEIAPEQIPYLAVAKGTGIIEGFPDGAFHLQDTATRAEMVAILLRYEDVEGRNADQFQALNEFREVGLTGTNVTSITPYKYSQETERDERGRIQKRYIRFIGIYLNDHTDYKAMEKFLQNPDVVIRYDRNPGEERIVKFRDLHMSLRDAAYQGMDAGESVYLGLQNPVNMSDEEMDMYLADPYASVVIDRSRIPFTNFSNVVDQPIKIGDLAVLQLHRMIFIPVGDGSEHSPGSVYASLLDEDQLTRGVSGYLILTETTIHLLKDTDLLSLLNAEGHARGNPLLQMSRIPQEIVSKSGLPVMPANTTGFFAEGSIRRFWSYTFFPMDQMNSFGLTTDSGNSFSMYKQ